MDIIIEDQRVVDADGTRFIITDNSVTIQQWGMSVNLSYEHLDNLMKLLNGRKIEKETLTNKEKGDSTVISRTLKTNGGNV